MVKGINKQIIEISCTNNEHFEKILLIARPDSELFTNSELCGSAEAILSGLDCGGNALGFTDRSDLENLKLHNKVLYTITGILSAVVLALSLALIL